MKKLLCFEKGNGKWLVIAGDQIAAIEDYNDDRGCHILLVNGESYTIPGKSAKTIADELMKSE